ncbi:OmpA family protein [Flavobacterium sp.]|uniref:OmpA family protein n=1 Tax=Flavobacterium sp. TaxID=239 RepID=UPI0026385350|nr:OmpA family protein [Flavobacterium sp.]
MKKIFYILLLSQPFTTVFAQTEDDTTSKEKKPFNSWSIEVNVGQNKAVRPFTPGYYSSDPSKYFNFSDVNHIDLGVRYMFSNKFGLKFDLASDEVANQSGSGSLPFEVKQYRIALQGVANLGRIMAFETFTNRFNLLGHAGIQVSQLTPQMGVNKDVTEDNGGIIVGLTPQLRINKWLVVTGDFSVLSNVRQHFNWDGSYSAEDNNLSGMLYNTSLGLTVYLGKKEKHADWYLEKDMLKEIKSEDKEARRRLDDIETMLSDVDKDGVPDYLDSQNNTPAGLKVDTKGRFIDNNRNGVADELERTPNDGKDGINTTSTTKDDAIKSLIEKGFVNIFYNVNQDTPNSGSTNNIYYIIEFLRKYPETKVKLVGYADVRGGEKTNKDLSNRRAQKLFNIITASGIDASRLSFSAGGVDKSYTGDSKISLDLARRVAVILE